MYKGVGGREGEGGWVGGSSKPETKAAQPSGQELTAGTCDSHSGPTTCMARAEVDVLRGPVAPQVVPRHNWSPGPSMANFVAIDGPPGPTMAAMPDGPLCRKWSPHKYNMLLLQIPSTGLGRSVYVLPKCLTGCWLEAT